MLWIQRTNKENRNRWWSFTVTVDKKKLQTAVSQSVMLTAGVLIAAVGYVLFQIPHNISAGGIGGIALIVTHFFSDLPVGGTYWVLNIPMIILGFFTLGRWPFVGRTVMAATMFSVFTDLFNGWLPLIVDPYPVTDNMILNTIYGGIIGGIGGGLVYRSGSNFGGTAVLAKVVQQRTGWPLSQIYIIDDGAIILAMGVVFGWENAMFGLMMLFLNGIASDYTLEGVSNTRTLTIVTNQPDAVTNALFQTVKKGVSFWEVTGGYTKRQRYMVMCTVYRSQITHATAAVATADPEAFVTVGVSHQALGNGFNRLR